MDKSSSYKCITVTNDGTLCALVVDGHLNVLNVYDITKNKLLCRVKGTSNLFETKALRFSPSKETVAWLQSPPGQLLIVHIKCQKSSLINGHSELPFCHMLWSPDGKILATFSILSVFIDIYAVGSEFASHKASVSGAKDDELRRPLAQFSPDGEYFATVNVSSQGYSITIYDSGDTWDCVQRILCNESHNAGGLLWCADSASLLVWQSGPTLQLRLWTADGTVERSLAADDAAVCCLCLSDCGRVAAVLTADCKVRILDLLTWCLDMTEVLIHNPIIHKSSARSRLKDVDDSSIQVSTCETITATLFELHQDEALSRKRNELAQFSMDGQYLATYVSLYPSTLSVWRLTEDSPLETVVVLKEDTTVIDIFWHKEEAILGANLSSGRVLVWTPEKTEILNYKNNPWPFTAQEYLASLKTSDDEELPEFSK